MALLTDLYASSVPFQGDFWKPCPGTGGGYLCCGYQILSPARGCGMACRYCILQVYFDDPGPVRFSNYDDLEREVALKMAGRPGVVRFGTGELADSLFAEPELGLSRRVAATLEPYPNAVVEFKTKSTRVETLRGIARPERIVIGFSVNTPRMIALHEERTAPLAARLDAAARSAAMGFHVAFHFDPMFIYEGWEEEYRAVVAAIYSHVKDPRSIAWVSLGAFRTTPSLKKFLRRTGTHLPLFSGEMIIGSDGKLRYLRPQRVALFSAMRDEFSRYDALAPVYLCMESREVWEASGMAGRIPDGLPAYLDRQAERILAGKPQSGFPDLPNPYI
jgi:spore photoproduct lyase